MLSGSLVRTISQEVLDVRVAKGLHVRELAQRADVGTRFITNLERASSVDSGMVWDKPELIARLLRVLNALSLRESAIAVKKELTLTKPRKKRRVRFDKRNIVLRRRICRRK